MKYSRMILLQSSELFGDEVASLSMRQIADWLYDTGTDLPQHYAPSRQEMVETLRKNLLSQERQRIAEGRD